VGGYDYRDLVVWQRAMDLEEGVYQLTRSWPPNEQHGLSGQIQRAAVSIPANLAEGQGRGNPREFLRFVAIANGSLREVETHLMISCRLTYTRSDVLDRMLDDTAEVGRLLHGLMRSLRHQLGE
jgi:four helix bundle protein